MVKPVDEQALEDAAWSGFVQQLADHLAGQWPAMPDRLADRYAAFVDLAVQQAGQRGLAQAAGVARFVNLWFVWGPAFDDKPGFEWAQAILAAPHGREWLTVHQLVRRSLTELQRLPNARIAAHDVAAADARVLDAFAALGRRGAMRRAEPLPLPRQACDLEVVELRVLDDGWHQEYQLAGGIGGDWQRSPAVLPPPLRVGAAPAVPMPPLIALLSQQAGQGLQARLQVRVRTHAVCDGDVHPGVAFAGPHGRWSWAGHETRAVSWPVATREQPLPPAGPATSIAEETSPELHLLAIDSCGLRDEGDAAGALATRVAAWPAAQWWLDIQRAAPATQPLLPGTRAWAPGSTRCRVERDGAAQDAAPLRQRFEDGLDAATAVGLRTLAAAWETLPGLAAPRFDAALGLLVGRGAVTWGWRHAPQGLAGAALMRLVAALDFDAVRAELAFGGDLAIGATRSRIRLEVRGAAPWRHELRREAPQPDLAALLLPAGARWSLPFDLTITPLAGDDAALLQQSGPVSGALVGEAGLRPCTKGVSGWEWFVGLRVETVEVALASSDPLLGTSRQRLTLLPAATLVDWSL